MADYSRRVSSLYPTEEQKLSEIALAMGLEPSPEYQSDVVEQPITQEPEGASIALGDATYPEIESLPQNGKSQIINDPMSKIASFINAQKLAADPQLRRQEEGIKEYEGKIKDYENAPQQLNLQPVLSWLDSNYGTKTASGYKAPMSEQEKLEKIASLYKNLQDEKNKAVTNALSGAGNKLYGQALLKSTANDAAQDRLQQRQDFMAYKSVVDSIKKDPIQKQQLTQLRNLDNAATVFSKAKKIGPQQIQEFQYAIRANLGIKGTSGVGEREKQIIDTLGLRAEDWAQFLTGEPADIARNTELVKHLQDLAQNEVDNIKGQMTDRLDVLSEGYADVFDRRPNYKKNLDRLLGVTKKSLQPKTLTGEDAFLDNKKQIDPLEAEMIKRELK